MPTNCADPTLEVSHSGLARIVSDDGPQDVVADLALLFAQARRCELTFNQIAFYDRQLLVVYVAGHLDDFHPVANCGRNIVQHIGGADEQDF